MTKVLKSTLTRADFIQHLADRCLLNPMTAEKVVDLFCQQITTALAHDKTVTLRRFGTFKPKVRTEYVVRHPKGGQKIKKGPQRRVSFKVSPLLVKDLTSGDKT